MLRYVCEDELFPFTAWREMYVLIARYRLTGLKIIIYIKINASYFEFRSASSLHASDSILSRNISRGQNFFQ